MIKLDFWVILAIGYLALAFLFDEPTDITNSLVCLGISEMKRVK